MHKPTNMFLLATVVGALSAALAYRHLSQLRTEIDAARVAAAHATVGIVVASQTIPVGTSIERTSVKIVPWPKEFQPDGALSAVDGAKLTLATRQEPVRLALRNYRDEDLVRTPGISAHALLGGDERPVHAASDTGESVAPRDAVEILRGEQLTLQKVFRD